MAIDLTSNCLFHLKMNDNAANKVVVDSLCYVDGEAQRNTNLLSSPGKINQSLRNDDAIPDYIKVMEGAIGTVSFAVSIWVKFSDYSKTGALVSYRQSSSTLGIWTVSIRPDHKVQFITYRNGYGLQFFTGNPIPDDGDWHLIFAQRVEQTSTEDGYIWIDNGNTGYGSQTGQPKKSIEPFYPTNIGSNYNGNNALDVYLDCCALWSNRVLTQEERDFLWNNGLGTENMKSCARPLSGGSLAGKRGLT